MRNVNLKDFVIGDNNPVHIIAEIGGNFTDINGAIKLIDLACETGVDSVKLQTYRAETIAAKSAVYDMPNVGSGVSQFDLFKQYEVDLELHKEIWKYCKEKDVLIFSTPSHMEDVELLEKVDCPVYKLGSDDAINIPFLKDVAYVGKPIILSTGMCTMNEVGRSVEAVLSTGNADLILLHCITNYPAKHSSANLKCIAEMKREFGLPVGFSDHTLDSNCSLAAAALGANVIEKHFTFDKNADGPDHMLSADPEDMRDLVQRVRIIESALGDGVKRPSEEELITRTNNRKSLVALCDIKQGDIIEKDFVAIKRPGTGIQPQYLNEVIGRYARKDIKQESVISWDDV
jgi:sialic acid synthase SpsE